MRKVLLSTFLLAFGLAGSASFGQLQKTTPQVQPHAPLPIGVFKTLNVAPKQSIPSSRLSAATRAAVQGATVQAAGTQQPLIVRSVPNFTSSFTFQNQTFPFTMMGRQPQAGGTTRIGTSYLAISFEFDEFIDQNGNNIVIDATANTNILLNGPEFEQFPYTTGDTQFSDAVQRAEFFNVLKGDGDHDGDDRAWHTLLGNPRQFTPVTVEVPVGSAVLFQAPDGSILALMDINFLVSQLNTLIQTENLSVEEVPIFATRNTVYGDFDGFDSPVDCCIGGFHTAFETKQVRNTVFVQTFAFATSLDNTVANAFFGDPSVFGDVNALSHEITETYNDPFVNNIVPSWQFPDLPPGVCSNLLETGDPVENTPNDSFPVTIDGFLYHPQTEAVLQWFSRESPSSAFGGAYSYPGNNLTSASQACPTGP